MIEPSQFLTAALAAAGSDGFSFGQLAVLVVAVLGLSLVMVSTHRRIRRSGAASASSTQDRIAVTAARNRASRDLEAVMLELDELSRGIHGRLDTKLVRLEALIRDADRRIEQLAAATAAASPSEKRANTERIDIVVGDEQASVDRTSRATEAEPRRESHELIHAMADGGATVIDIARKAGRTPGEVELVLALRKTKEATAPAIRA